MAVQWDSVLCRETARELDNLLRGARLRALSFDSKRRRVSLFTDDGVLEWHLHPQEGVVRLYPAQEPFEEAFVLSAKVRGVEAPLDERRIVIHLQKLRGQDRAFALHIELATNLRNAFLVNAFGTIERAVTQRSSGDRKLQVGHPYPLPGGEARRGRNGAVARSEWVELFDTDWAERLRTIAWLSPLNKAGFEHAPDPYALWRRLAGLDPSSPVILQLDRGTQPYPTALPGVVSRDVESLLAAFAAETPDQSAPLDPSLESTLGRARAVAARRVGSLRRELERTDDPAVLRGQADLLLARLREIPRGVEAVELVGFDGDPVRVSMDPKLGPRENADALYDRAGRAERARRDLPDRIRAAEAEVDELDNALAGLKSGQAPDAALVARLSRRGRTSSQEGPALPYRVYFSSGGLEIWVGRGSKSNDTMTFKHARPNDIWLHARDSAGAHVVLRWAEDGSPPNSDLEEAAVLAALHSKARHAGLVPVDWTRRKYVRKPRKAPPGSVIPSHVKTVFVEPDPERAEAMAVRD